jgi:hypothetical protein
MRSRLFGAVALVVLTGCAVASVRAMRYALPAASTRPVGSAKARGGVISMRLPAVSEAVAVGSGRVWVAAWAASAVPVPGHLFEIDPRTLSLIHDEPVGGAPDALALTGNVIWVADGIGLSVPGSHGTKGRVVRDVNTLARVVRADSGRPRARYVRASDPVAVLPARSMVWTLGDLGERLVVQGFSRAQMRLRISLSVNGLGPACAALGGGSLWVVSSRRGSLSQLVVTRISLRSPRVAKTMFLPGVAASCTYGGDALWVTTNGNASGSGRVLKIDGRSRRNVALPVKLASVGGIAFFRGELWVSVGDHRVDELDPVSGRRVASRAIPRDTAAILSGGPAGLWGTSTIYPLLVRIEP